MICANCGTELPDGAAFCFQCGNKIQAVSDAVEIQESQQKQQTQRPNQKKESEGSGWGALLGALAVAGAGYAAYKGVSNHNAAERERLRREQEARENAETGKKMAGLALGALGNAVGGPVAGGLLSGLASILTGEDDNNNRRR